MMRASFRFMCNIKYSEKISTMSLEAVKERHNIAPDVFEGKNCDAALTNLNLCAQLMPHIHVAVLLHCQLINPNMFHFLVFVPIRTLIRAPNTPNKIHQLCLTCLSR
jgi:hypothetical protein